MKPLNIFFKVSFVAIIKVTNVCIKLELIKILYVQIFVEKFIELRTSALIKNLNLC